MSRATNHLAAIKADAVTKTNVIGMRKAINANERRMCGLSTSSTCPKLTSAEIAELDAALKRYEPRVTGVLHDSGLKLLRDRRYKKRLESVRSIIDNLVSFHLVAYDLIDDHAVPVYRAQAKSKSFLFRNIAWQAGGNGPEIIEVNQ